jgi:hypothetical protein
VRFGVVVDEVERPGEPDERDRDLAAPHVVGHVPLAAGDLPAEHHALRGGGSKHDLLGGERTVADRRLPGLVGGLADLVDLPDELRR